MRLWLSWERTGQACGKPRAPFRAPYKLAVVNQACNSSNEETDTGSKDQKIKIMPGYILRPAWTTRDNVKKKKISEESYTALSLQGTLSKRRSNRQNTFPEERAVSQTGICGRGVFMESPIIYSNSKRARPVDTGAQWHYPEALRRIWWCWTLLARIKLGSSKMASDSGLHSLSSSVLGFVESRHIPGMWGVIYRSVYNSQCLHHWRKSLSLSQAAINCLREGQHLRLAEFSGHSCSCSGPSMF